MKKKGTQKETNTKKEEETKKAKSDQQIAYLNEAYKLQAPIFTDKCSSFRMNLKTRFNIQFSDNKEFILQWLSARKEYDEEICYAGKEVENLPLHLIQLNSVSFFNTTHWNIRIHQHVISKAAQMTIDQLISLLWTIQQINDGYFNGFQRVQVSKARLNLLSEFMVANNILNGFQMVAMIGIEQRPILNKNNTQVSKFSYHQFIMLLCIVPNSQIVDQEFIFQKYNDTIKDPVIAGGNNANISSFLKHIRYVNNQTYFYKAKEGEEDKSVETILPKDFTPLYDVSQKYVPIKLEEQFLTFEESSLLSYDESLNRWVETEKQMLLQKDQEREERAGQNKYALSRFADFASAQKMVELLQKIKSLKLKLTEEEINVIGQPGNVIVIGRSGTGKTTCAVLRLFAMEILFHIRVQMMVAKDAKILQDAANNEQIGLQSVFITASPVLANQIKKYYRKLTNQVKEEIRQNQLKKQAEAEANPSDTNASQISAAYSLVQTLHGGDTNEEESKLQNKENEDLEHCLNEISMQKKPEDPNDNNDIEDEFEDDDANDRFEFSESNEKGKSLADMKQEDFPSFQTVRSYLMLIEACLNVPFFPRDAKGQVVGQEGASSWSNYKSISLKLQGVQTSEESEAMRAAFYDEDNLEEVYKREMYLLSHANAEGGIFEKDSLEKEKPEDRKFEVDYEYFESAFWPVAAAKFKDSNLISCSTLWTEIYSHIKGSSNSFSYPGRRMVLSDYLSRVDLNALLSNEQRNVIYSMSEYYEKWKRKQSGYDLMDVANYLLQEIKSKRASIPSIHFTMIDEVQDLPYALITLFSLVNEQALFLAGDSAQTIARGVGFRFQELQAAFRQLPHYFERKLAEPTIKQLTVNFRSHNKILQLSNSVVNLLEALFPTSIDILKKERSNIDGFKPIILTGSDLNFLFTLLSGHQDSDPLGQNIPLEFGCNQVIIVKDNESKAKLPAVLQHAICLTIYEAKGLEFDDVILFDFFKDSKSSVNSWASVGLLAIQQEKMTKEIFLKMMTMHDGVFDEQSRKNWEEGNFETAYGVTYNEEKDEVSVYNPVKKSHELNAFDRVANAFLCSELKQLYTAITRPKKRLIIFDTETQKRKQIEQYWGMQNLVSLVSEIDIEGEKQETEKEKEKKLSKKVNPNEIKVTQEKTEIIESMKKLLVKNSSAEWFEQGLRMFRFKYFEQAVKCFKKSGHTDYEKKAQAYFEAKSNSDQIIKLESDLQLLRKKIGQYAFMKERLCQLEHSKILKLIKQCKENFTQIGEKFLEIGRKKQAAKCFFSGNQFERAGEIYEELGQKKEAAESFLLGGFQEKAANLYELAGEIQKAVDSLEIIGKWEKILVLLNAHENSYTSSQLQELRLKYLKLSLSGVIEKPQNKQIEESWILERDEYDEMESSEDENEKEEESNEDDYEKLDKGKKVDDQEIQKSEEDEEIIEKAQDNQSEIESSKQESVLKNEEKFSEFSILDKECLSAIDGEDEWLQLGDGKSIKDLLLESQSFNDISFSSYSVIEKNNPREPSDQGYQNNNSQVIQPKSNTGISNDKLLNIIGLLLIGDSEFKTSISKLVDCNGSTPSQESILKILLYQDSQISTQISCEIVDLIISRLVQLSSEKVALHVCNRFIRTKQLHQIVINLAAEYSPLIRMNASVAPHYLSFKTSDPRVQQQKILGIIANTALHGILESVEPSMLSGLTNTFNLFSSKQLIHGLLLLGFWKKIVFLADQSVGLAISECFNDYNAYKAIWNNNFSSNADDTPLLIMEMEQFITNNLRKNKITSASVSEIPSRFSFNQHLWKFLSSSPQESKYPELVEFLNKVNTIILGKGTGFSQAETFDIVSTFWQLVRLSTEQLMEKTPLNSTQRAMIVEQARVFANQFYSCKFSKQIIRGVLSAYSVKLVPEQLIDVWGSSTAVVSRSSVLSTPHLIKASIIFNRKNKSKDNNRYFFCDVSCEYISLPISCVFLVISQKIPPVDNSIILPTNNSSGIVAFRRRNQKLFQNNENGKNGFAIQYLNNDEFVQFLQYGNTQKYIEKYKSIHGNVLRDINHYYFSEILHYAIIQAIINNFNETNQMTLIIPSQTVDFFQALEKHQSLLKEQMELSANQKLPSKKKEQLQSMEDKNQLKIYLNLNGFDNKKDIDDLVRDLLERAEEASKNYDPEYDDNGEFNAIADNYAFVLAMTLIANLSDILPETFNDLIEALKLIPLYKPASKFINSSQEFEDILDGKNMKDVRDAGFDLIQTKEFKKHFENFKIVKFIIHGDQKENTQIEMEDREMIRKELLLRKTSGVKVSKFLVDNRMKMKELGRVQRNIQNLNDLFSRTKLNSVKVSGWMLQNKIYLDSFVELNQLQSRILRLIYEKDQFNDQFISVLLSLLEEKAEFVDKLCGQIENAVTNRQEANPDMNSQIEEFLEKSNSKLQAHLDLEQDKKNQKAKKKFRETIGKQNAQKERVLQLLRKRANLLKQEKMQDLKQIRTMVNRKR